MKTGALILAAGLSSRMRAFKPMLELAGKTLVEHVIGHFRQFGCEYIFVVTGRDAQILESFLTEKFPGQIDFVRNPDYATSDMFTSVKLGLKALPEDCTSIFLTPADVPLFDAALLTQMDAVAAPVVRPSYKGKAGHPVLLRKNVWCGILSYQGEGGLKGALQTAQQAFVEAASAGILLDADTPEDLQRLREFLGR
ncbi:NTP transferase domain-containing protein [Selenomonas sp. AE3005]|uniref:nucleotidyltransferase family protein n=1 Tax=Selenomonas sp. AE3005 TaxID=1485543 RepID=UPI000907A4EF|nr:nucleotidyltransferase family protein [Selenomonas sp. AE3005]